MFVISELPELQLFIYSVDYLPSSWAPESSSSTLLRGGSKDGLLGRCASVILNLLLAAPGGMLLLR